MQKAGDKVSVVVGNCDAMPEKHDGYKASPDRFKAEYEESQSDLEVVKAKLAAYQAQGFWGRLFRWVPY